MGGKTKKTNPGPGPASLEKGVKLHDEEHLDLSSRPKGEAGDLGPWTLNLLRRRGECKTEYLRPCTSFNPKKTNAVLRYCFSWYFMVMDLKMCLLWEHSYINHHRSPGSLSPRHTQSDRITARFFHRRRTSPPPRWSSWDLSSAPPDVAKVRRLEGDLRGLEGILVGQKPWEKKHASVTAVAPRGVWCSTAENPRQEETTKQLRWD